jgi:hypothetical protein
MVLLVAIHTVRASVHVDKLDSKVVKVSFTVLPHMQKATASLMLHA